MKASSLKKPSGGEELRSLVEVIANQLCQAVDGKFDFTVKAKADDETIEKLQMLVNFMLDAARRSLTAMEELDRAKSQFMANVSHELRTPLTLILGPLNSILSSCSGDTVQVSRTDLERMQRNSQRLFNLVDDVLDFSKLEAGRMTVNWRAIEVTPLVAGAINDARAAAEARGISLQFSSDDGIGTVPLDRHMFERMLLNLVGNALKFTPSGGRIEVKLRSVGDDFEFSVADTGPGMPKDRLPLLFKRFQQIDTSSTRRHEGTGLGLALVKEYANLMYGEVGVESELGKGSRFFVRLPRGADRLVGLENERGSSKRPEPGLPSESFQRLLPQGSRRTPAHKPESGMAKPHVLVADDNEDMREYVSDILADDYEIEVVDNGRKALEAARARRPDVIVSDIMMPEMDGIELVSHLKQDPALQEIPVVIVTAKAGREAVVSSLEGGADEYLSKPFGTAELRARVRAVYRLHKMYKEVEEKRRELARSNAELEQFAYVASHDLQEPLRMVASYTQLLAQRYRGRLDSDADEFIAYAVDGADRMRVLIEDLLAYSRVGTCGKELQQTSCEVVLDQSLVNLERVTEESGAVITHDPLPRVMADKAQLVQVFQNLIGNALKFRGAEPPRIHVSAARSGHEWLFSVQDNGIGLDPQYADRIFVMFQRLHARNEHPGSGMGLAICKKIVERHSGRIWVESQPGKGSTFHFTLPATGDRQP